VATRSDFDREMQILEAELKRLEAEYNMFFAGRLPRLPWESRARVETIVRRHDRSPMQNTAERFRFQSLQARFASFCELWDRTQRAREEGRVEPLRRRRTAAAPPPAATASVAETAAPPAEARPERTDGVVAEASVRDLAGDAERVKELYQQLSEARRDFGEQPVPYERFEKLVSTQLAKLGTGGKPVAFRVTIKDGKVSLTAKTAKER
jgi:hypothetical protein